MMKTSLVNKLQTLAHRFAEIGTLMSDLAIMNDQNRFRELGKEYAQLEPVADCYRRLNSLRLYYT